MTYKVTLHLYSADGRPIDSPTANALLVRAWYKRDPITSARSGPSLYKFEGPRSEDSNHVLVVVKEKDRGTPSLFRWYEFYFDDRTESVVHVRLHPVRTDRSARANISELIKGIRALRNAGMSASAIRKELDESVRYLVTEYATSTGWSEGDGFADLVDSFNVSAPVAFRTDTELVVATGRTSTISVTISSRPASFLTIDEECPFCVVAGEGSDLIIRAWDAELDWPSLGLPSRDIGRIRCLAYHSSEKKQVLAAGESNGVISLSSNTGRATWQHKEPIYHAASPLQALAFSPNGDMLATINLKNQLVLHTLRGNRKVTPHPASADLGKRLSEKGVIPTALTFCGSNDRLALAAGLGASGSVYFISGAEIDLFQQETPHISSLRWRKHDQRLLGAALEVGDDNTSKLTVRHFSTPATWLPSRTEAAPEALVCIPLDDKRDLFG